MHASPAWSVAAPTRPTTGWKRLPSRLPSGSLTTGGAYAGSQTPHGDLNAEWRLAHHLSSVGAGYHWPNVSIWGEGSRVGIAVHADANNLKPSLKFVAKPRFDYVPSSSIEDAIDRFVRAVLESVGDASDGLGTEYRQLQSERTEPSVAAWRKLEAMLGFDPDDAPDGLVARMEALSE